MGKNIIAILLIVGAIILGYLGITTYQESTASANILGIELSASDEGGQTTAYLYIGLAVILLIGGLVTLNRKG